MMKRDSDGDSENGLLYEEERLSIITPVGYSVSTCGYCSEPGSSKSKRKKGSKSYGFWAYNLTPEAYQCLIDRGWRRSGQYVYRPDCGEKGTCCAQLAIRLNVKDFKPNKQQRGAFNALHHFVRTSNSTESKPSSFSLTSQSFTKGKYASFWDLEKRWNLIEWQENDQEKLLLQVQTSNSSSEQKKLLGIYHNERSKEGRQVRKGEIKMISPPQIPRKRRLRATLHIANSSDEKYQLFRKYQASIHREDQDEISSKEGFERFLCQTPFLPTLPGSPQNNKPSLPSSEQLIDIHSSNPIHFGLYHMEWRLDDRLIAVGVLDILPRCISSVYLFYDPDDNAMQLGKISAIREIALVRQIQKKRGMGSVQYYNMGLYVHTCAKMRYKAQFRPSELLDPKTCVWIKFDEVSHLLNRGVRYDFLNDENGSIGNVESDKKKKSEVLFDDNESEKQLRGRNMLEDEKKDIDEGEGEKDDDDDEKELPRPLPPGIEDPNELTSSQIARCAILRGGNVYPISVSDLFFDSCPCETLL